MSVAPLKPNMPGIGSSFGGSRKTGMSRQVSVNLSNSSAAGKTTGFSLSPKSRYNWTPGVKVSGDTSKYNYQGVRARLNGGGQVRNSGFYGTGSTRVNDNFNLKVDNGSAYNTGMAIAQTALGVFGMLNQLGIIGGNKATAAAPVEQTSNSEKLKKAMNGLGSGVPKATSLTSGAASEAIAKMAECKDSTALRAAIDDAQSKYDALKAELPKKEEAARVAQGKVDKLNETVGKAEAEVNDLSESVTQQEQSVESFKKKLSGLNADYSEKCSALDKAESDLATATANLESAESELANAKNLPADDPTRAAKIAAAESKVNNAKAEKAKAEKAKAAAEKAKEEAFNAITENKEQIKQAETQLEKAKEKLETSKKELKAKEKELNKAKDDLKKQNDIIDEFTTASQDVNVLEQTIKDQRKNLEKMEKAEVEEWSGLLKDKGKADKKNQKLWGKINAGDGMSNKEINRLGKISENNTENEARAARIAELEPLAISTALNHATGVTGSDGSEYKLFTLKENKQEYCFKDGQKINVDDMPEDVKAKFAALNS